MPYTIKTKANVRKRYLLSGLPNTGKSDSLITAIYGNREYRDDSGNIKEEAIEYANDRHMNVIVCPGEKGHESLFDGPHVTNYIYELEKPVDNKLKWSIEAVKEFESLVEEMIGSLPDILVIDGLPSYYKQKLNIVTNGALFDGKEFQSWLYGRCNEPFIQFLTDVYTSQIPLVIMTTWEVYRYTEDNLSVEQKRQEDRQGKKVLQPNLPGQMADTLAGHFSARLSCQVEKQCLHENCEDTKNHRDHFVWQFYPKGDVKGVGIKGLKRIPQKWRDKPWIHQNYQTLERLLEQVT